MITISLTLNVQLDAADLAAFDARLGAIMRGVKRFTEDTEVTQRHTEKERENPSVNLRADSVNSVNPPPPPTAQNRPGRRKPDPRPPTMPAPARTPVLPAILAATAKVDEMDGANGIDKSRSSPVVPTPSEVASEVAAHPSARLPFAEFDKLVRGEMKRLSMDGRLPGHKLWNNERDARLPTMAAILLRYGTTTLIDLAKVFGLQPPLSAAKENQP